MSNEASGSIGSGQIVGALDPALYEIHDGEPRGEGGIPLVFEITGKGLARLRRYNTATDTPDDLVGFTSYNGHAPDIPSTQYMPERAKNFRGVSTGTVDGAHLYGNDVVLAVSPVGTVVYFSPSLGKLSLLPGTDGIVIGYIASNHWRLPTRTGYSTILFEETKVSHGHNELIGAPVYLPAISHRRTVGDEAIVFYQSNEDDDPATITVFTSEADRRAGTPAFTTVKDGEAKTFRITVVPDSYSTPPSWEVTTGKPVKVANVSINIAHMKDLYRKQQDLISNPIRSRKVAGTTGVKSTWTIESTAPSTIVNDTSEGAAAGTLTVPIPAGQVFRISAKGSTDTAWDTMLVPMTRTSTTYTLHDGDITVSVKSGVRVTHQASGMTAQVEVWLLEV